ncbi:YihY/virulence factor BrkB family protein [Lacunimicrobium album]
MRKFYHVETEIKGAGASGENFCRNREPGLLLCQDMKVDMKEPPVSVQSDLATPVGLRAVPPFWPFVRQVINSFFADDCTSNAAALSFATIFSLPPLTALIIWMVGTIVPAEIITESVEAQLSNAVGSEIADGVKPFLETADSRSATMTGAFVGIVGVIIGALGMFLQLHASLNRVWGVQADPDANGFLSTLLQRLVAVSMVMALILIMLVAIVLETLTSETTRLLALLIPEWLSQNAAYLMQNMLTMSLFVLVLVGLFKYVPDVRVKTRHAVYGAVFTAVLFFIGKFLIAYVVSEERLNTSYGRASALAMLMIWVYYSSLIILLGAEFVQAWAMLCGYPVLPERHAVRVRMEIVREDSKPLHGRL